MNFFELLTNENCLGTKTVEWRTRAHFVIKDSVRWIFQPWRFFEASFALLSSSTSLQPLSFLLFSFSCVPIGRLFQFFLFHLFFIFHVLPPFVLRTTDFGIRLILWHFSYFYLTTINNNGKIKTLTEKMKKKFPVCELLTMRVFRCLIASMFGVNAGQL